MTFKTKSFTLIEMLIVIVIIGILAAALIPRLQSVQGRARDAKRKIDISTIANAVTIFYEDNGAYPYNIGSWFCSTVYPTAWNCASNSDQGASFINGLVPNYVSALPLDPRNTFTAGTICDTACILGDHVYSYKSIPGYATGRTNYIIMAQLENRTDPDRCELKAYPIWIASRSTACSTIMTGYGYGYKYLYSRQDND